MKPPNVNRQDEARVSCPKPRFESAALIEAMHRRVGSTALHQDVVAIHFPRFGQGSAHYRTAMPAALKLRMRHDVFEGARPAAGWER